MQIQLKKLYEQWNNLNQEELQAEQPPGTVSKLVRDELLSIQRSKTTLEKIKKMEKEIGSLYRTKNTAQLKNYILQIYESDITHPGIQDLESEIEQWEKQRDFLRQQTENLEKI